MPPGAGTRLSPVTHARWDWVPSSRPVLVLVGLSASLVSQASHATHADTHVRRASAVNAASLRSSHLIDTA